MSWFSLSTFELTSLDWANLRKKVPPAFQPLLLACEKLWEKAEMIERLGTWITEKDMGDFIRYFQIMFSEYMAILRQHLNEDELGNVREDIRRCLSIFFTGGRKELIIQNPLSSAALTITSTEKRIDYFLNAVFPMVAAFVYSRIYYPLVQVYDLSVEAWQKNLITNFAIASARRAGIIPAIEKEEKEAPSLKALRGEEEEEEKPRRGRRKKKEELEE